MAGILFREKKNRVFSMYIFYLERSMWNLCIGFTIYNVSDLFVIWSEDNRRYQTFSRNILIFILAVPQNFRNYMVKIHIDFSRKRSKI